MTAIYPDCCFRYHKGTDFQANHNTAANYLLQDRLFQIPQRYRFSSKSQPLDPLNNNQVCCFRYHKGTDFQANHNSPCKGALWRGLFQIPQRYRFSSKSQQGIVFDFNTICCFRYHKGTDFQANHNINKCITDTAHVVLDTTKVQIFKQITTPHSDSTMKRRLFQIPQRYRFSSKSQPCVTPEQSHKSCFRYHKGTDFQANHNYTLYLIFLKTVVLDTTKVQIFKQITTHK